MCIEINEILTIKLGLYLLQQIKAMQLLLDVKIGCYKTVNIINKLIYYVETYVNFVFFLHNIDLFYLFNFIGTPSPNNGEYEYKVKCESYECLYCWMQSLANNIYNTDSLFKGRFTLF